MSKNSSEKKTAVMEAALGLFVERGFHGAPTSLIAERADVGIGTIYRYFPSKETLIHSIFEELHLRFHQRLPGKLEDGAPLRDRLTAFLGILLNAFIEAPADFRFLEQYYYSPFANPEQPEIPHEQHNALHNLLQEGRDAGLFKEGPLPVLQAIALGPVLSLAKEHIAGRLVVDNSTVELVKKACWEALLKQGPGGP